MSNDKTVDFLHPVGRLVQGGFDAQTTDNKGQPLTIKTGPNKGQPATRYFIAVAYAKDDPAFAAAYGQMLACAQAGFPQYFPNGATQATHPRFTFKIMDGDGLDNDGKPNNQKEGFAGHWVIKYSSSYPPKCYYSGKYAAHEQIENPTAVIKRGYFVRVAGNMAPNIGSDVPGLYMNHNMVELVALGDEITSGPDAAAVYGAAPAAALPAGARPLPAGMAPGSSTIPTPGAAPSLPTPGAAPAGLPTPGAAPSLPTPGAMPTPAAGPGPALPAAPGALPPAPGATPGLPPPPPTGPVYTMTAKAQGGTREAFHGIGWTDEQLIAQGMMTQA